MSNIKIRKMLSGSTKYAGRTWIYDYRALFDLCSEKDFQIWWQKKNKAILKLTTPWDDKKHTEWLLRNMLAAKMIMGSTLHLNSLDFAVETNLRVVESYLEYYSVLHAIRSLTLSMTSQNWQNEALLNQNHSAAVNIACDAVAELNKVEGQKFRQAIVRLKANRELISYRAPTSGNEWKQVDLDLTYICIIFCELAQLHSELLETAIEKKYASGMNFNLHINDFKVLYNPKIDGHVFPDSEELYRIEYLLRKHPMPTNICHILTEGHVDYFFDAWGAEDEGNNKQLFNADTNWQRIFDLP